MKKLLLIAALSATTMGGVAIATQAGDAGPGGPARGERMLKRVDTNGDGAISQAEMRAQAEKRFARQDANKDGQLSADELRAPRGKHGGGRHGWRGRGGGGLAGAEGGPSAMIDRMFERLDTNRDGTVTRAEADAAKTQWAQRGEQMRTAMLKRVDTNGDGAVSKAEAMAQADARFARQDANKDGRIDVQEREAIRGKWRDRMAQAHQY